MSLYELAKNLLGEDQVNMILRDRINERIQDDNFMLVPIEDGEPMPKKRIERKEKIKAISTGGKKVPIKIHGKEYESKSEACRVYGITQAQLNAWIKAKRNLDDCLVPPKEADHFIENQADLFPIHSVK